MPVNPVIGIAAATEAKAEPCAAVVERSGGVPLTILPDDALAPAKALQRLGGLLVSGGADAAVVESGGEAGQDAAVVQLLKAALDDDMPVLGIGSGMQMLNVALGGSVIQNVAGHGPSPQDGEDVSSYHRVYIAPGSKLAAIVGSGGFVRVNSRHRDGVTEGHKSPLLLASAYSLDDGVIEALESPGHDWVIGVQFHPERRLEIPPHFDRLFQGLVERAGRRLDASDRS